MWLPIVTLVPFVLICGPILLALYPVLSAIYHISLSHRMSFRVDKVEILQPLDNVTEIDKSPLLKFLLQVREALPTFL